MNSNINFASKESIETFNNLIIQYNNNNNIEWLISEISKCFGINNCISVVPPEKSNGVVLSIRTSDSTLDKDGIENGMLILFPNSSIKEHSHSINDVVEMYIKKYGECMFIGTSCNDDYNSESFFNICILGTHGIISSDLLRIVYYSKIKPDFSIYKNKEDIINYYKKTISNN